MKVEKLSASNKVYLIGAESRLGQEILRQTKMIPVVLAKRGLENEIISDFSVDRLKEIFRDADAVIHLAGSRDLLDQKKTREGDVELTRNVVNAIPKKAKLIFSSSITVYGKKKTQVPADEETEPRPDTPYANGMLEAEKIVARHPNHVILRIGQLYGTMFREYFRILNMVKDGGMQIIGDGKNRIPLVHVADVAKAINNAIENGHGTYVLVGECLSQKEILALAAKTLGEYAEPGKEQRIILSKKSIPAWQAKAYVRFFSLLSRLLKVKPALLPGDIDLLTANGTFDCSKAKKELGFSPRPLSEGIFEMVLYMLPVP